MLESKIVPLSLLKKNCVSYFRIILPQKVGWLAPNLASAWHTNSVAVQSPQKPVCAAPIKTCVAGTGLRGATKGVHLTRQFLANTVPNDRHWYLLPYYLGTPKNLHGTDALVTVSKILHTFSI